MRKLQTDPKMSIYLSCVSRAIIMKNLVIKNIGFGPAYNITFELSQNFTLCNGKMLNELKCIKTGIPYMAPQYEMEFLLTDSDWKKYADISFTMKVKYQNSIHTSFEDTFIIDFSAWKDLEIVNPKGFADVVVELNKINTTLEKMNSE